MSSENAGLEERRMGKQLLLDCTLRDGGYVNDWEFGFGSIKSIISRLDKSGVDMIEIGFVDQRRPYDENRTIYPDVKSISPIFKNLKKPKALIFAMIDYGTCGIDKICPRLEASIDGIRVIFKKKDQDGAMELLRQIKEKGYKIVVNPVSITSYNDEELKALIKKINRVQPFAVTVVDTYGLMHSRELLHYFNIYNEKLNPDIILGYHAHNNFQMAYANSITLMNKRIKRTISIDGTLFGMGKSAGNASLELIAMYMNEVQGRNFDIDQLQEAIDTDIQREYQKQRWGYNTEYYISALNDCHPSYVQYLRKRGTLSVKSINQILRSIPSEKKLSFDSELIETLYSSYQRNTINDTNVLETLQKALSERKLLLLGPGKTIEDHISEVQRFIELNNPIIVSINFLNENYPIDYVFISNSKRYSQFFDKIYGETSRVKLICTSNITQNGEETGMQVNYSSLLASEECILDNPLILFIHLLDKIGVKEFFMAGFDGYVPGLNGNYYGAYIPYLYCQQDLIARNEAISKEIASYKGKIAITSITPTRYL